MRTLLLATALLAPSLLASQAAPADLTRERNDRIHWITADPLSPARAISLTLIPPAGVTLGPEGSDIPVAGVGPATITAEGSGLVLRGWGNDLALPVGRATMSHGLRFVPRGTPGRFVLLTYRDVRVQERPRFYPYRRAARMTVTLTPGAPRTTHILEPQGTTVEATDAGTIRVPFGDSTATLHVLRIQGDGDESELLINFRDGTTGQGSYPAGRFVELIPQGGDRYLLDLNRAYNPNCAYSSVFPCPIPWAGNVIAAKVEAGEMYPPTKVN